MFFPERIRSIEPNDVVLDVGPGGTAFGRADVLLEREFEDESTAAGQRGFAQPLQTTKKIVYYQGASFPFADKEFDYVVCSQVLEHVEDVDAFLSEIQRVGRRGYLEYPTLYYDYIYNFPQHTCLLFRSEDIVYWLPKAATGIDEFRPVQRFFYDSLRAGYTALVDGLREYIFQGFEWEGNIVSRRADSLEDLVYAVGSPQLPSANAFTTPGREGRVGLVGRFLRTLRSGWGAEG